MPHSPQQKHTHTQGHTLSISPSYSLSLAVSRSLSLSLSRALSLTQGILLCTDVAARGLDIPSVHWIIQFDPPDEPKEYIHRVGRTARGTNTQGRALLMLLPQELQFLKYLRQANVSLTEYEFPPHKIANMQNQLEALITKNYYLHRSAKDAYRSYLLAYASHSLKNIYDVKALDLVAVAKSFGFEHPPQGTCVCVCLCACMSVYANVYHDAHSHTRINLTSVCWCVYIRVLACMGDQYVSRDKRDSSSSCHYFHSSRDIQKYCVLQWSLSCHSTR